MRYNLGNDDWCWGERYHSEETKRKIMLRTHPLGGFAELSNKELEEIVV